MGIGLSLVFIAAGAILTWAVSVQTSGVDLNAVGVILMVVGALGLVLSLVFWSSWGSYPISRNGGSTTVVSDRVERERERPLRL
jgi:hypothetical protein